MPFRLRTAYRTWLIDPLIFSIDDWLIVKCNVCIIGAGPAGLMAAISASDQSVSAVLVDGNLVAGRKLLKTGRGRCNLSHVASIDELVKAYGKGGEFLKHSLYEFSPENVREYLAKYGLLTKVEGDGLVFPVTNRATDVSRVLVDNARRAGIQFVYGKKVNDINKTDSGFLVDAGTEQVLAAAVIIATGGISWSFTGSTGDGYEFARKLGHTIAEPKAALVPLVTIQDWPGKLQGVGVGKVTITAAMDDRKIKAAGPLIFTGDGIGGSVVLDISRLITDHLCATQETVEIFIDLMPGMNASQLDKLIVDECAANPKKELAGLLTKFLPRALILFLCDRLDPGRCTLAGQLTRDKREELVKATKALTVTVKSTRPIAEATITRGGVCIDEIDSKTMQSKLCEGLFFAGEVIDVDGPCGGYNLQIAWSTGTLAGKNASKA